MAIETLPNRMKGKAPTWKGKGKGREKKKKRGATSNQETAPITTKAQTGAPKE